MKALRSPSFCPTKAILCRPHVMALAMLLTTVPTGGAMDITSNLTFKADLTLKETYDSNVYLQDAAPDPTVANAAPAFHESFVTSVTPRLALDWKPMQEFNCAVSYAPEVVNYHSAASESHVAHRTALTFSGQVHAVTWEQFNTFTYIDGSREGLTFGIRENGVLVGAPAIGGIPLRDRRAAVVYRNGFRVFHPHGNWFFRPVAWSYIHDFQTAPRALPGYQNYVDRNDFTVGMDIGYKLFKEAYFLVGYRFGFQEEPDLPVHYSNDYHRFVMGLEGKITDWLKIMGVIGPDYRDFDHATPVGFDDHHIRMYYDATVVITPTKLDTITLLARKYEQPAFGAPSVYLDITWEGTWKHAFTKQISASAGFRAYGGDWLAPVLREDWIYTPSAALSYVYNQHLGGELSYSYDWVHSAIPNTTGREFTRHLLSLSVKYSF